MNTVRAFIHFITIFIILFDFVENKKLQKSFEEIFGDGWHLKEMGEEGEEKEKETNLGEEKEEEAKLGEEKEEEANLAQIMAQENDQQQKRSGEDQSNRQMINKEGSTKNDQNEEDKNEENGHQQKREIIGKFRAIKEKIRQRKGKQSRKEWIKIECLLAKKMCTNRTYVYRWIREFRMGEQKKHIISNKQKRKIVREFQTIKEGIKQKERKFSRKQWNQMDKLLAQKLGTNQRYVYKWSKELGMGQRKMKTNEQRMAILRKYWEMKRNDLKMSDKKIAKALKVSRESIRKWNRKFGEGREGAEDAF